MSKEMSAVRYQGADLILALLIGLISALIMLTVGSRWFAAFIRDPDLRNLYIVCFSASMVFVFLLTERIKGRWPLRYLLAALFGWLFSAFSVNLAAIIDSGGWSSFVDRNAPLGVWDSVATILVSCILGGWLFGILSALSIDVLSKIKGKRQGLT